MDSAVGEPGTGSQPRSNGFRLDEELMEILLEHRSISLVALVEKNGDGDSCEDGDNSDSDNQLDEGKPWPRSGARENMLLCVMGCLSARSVNGV